MEEKRKEGKEEMERDVYVLAVESSCDETAAAVIRNGREILSNVISSQIALHTLYGGVVPELASRKHIENINPVIEQALSDAGKTLDEIDAIGVTYWTGTGGRAAGRRGRSQGDCLCEEETADRCTSHRRPLYARIFWSIRILSRRFCV